MPLLPLPLPLSLSLPFLAAQAAAQAGKPGESPDSPVVIRVGPIGVTLDEFSRDFHYEAKADTSTLQPDSASVERFLRGYLRTIRLHAAILPDTSVFSGGDRYSIEMNRDMLLQSTLREELLLDYMPTDDATLREIHERLGRELHLAVIKVPTLVDIDSVQTALANGAQFGAVARRFSKDLRTAGMGGDLGWVPATKLPLSHQRALWNLPSGAVSPVLPEPNFHVLYKILGERPVETVPAFEESRDTILRSLAMLELGRVGREMHDDLMARYGFGWDDEAAEWLRAFLERETASARRTYDPKLDKSEVRLGDPHEGPFWSEAPLQGEEAARPVAWIDGDTLTALGVIDQLVFKPTLVWPLFQDRQNVIDLCDEAMYYRVQVREAFHRGIDKRPEVVRQLLNFRRWVQWRAYRRERILPKITPTEEELLSLWARTPSLHSLPERRRYVMINLPTTDLAAKAAAALREGRGPVEIAQELRGPGLTISVTPDSGYGLVPRRQSVYDPVVFSLKAGEVSEPVADRGGFTVARVDEISPAHARTFEDARGELLRSILEERERREVDSILASQATAEVWVDRQAIHSMPFDSKVFLARGRVEGS
ncbi:MAG: peptidyl-prolyl cis-trans isomerase [Candidatus Eisenbacteria bacterium]